MAAFPLTFGALRHRDFRWLWAGTLCSTGSQWIQQATLGWVVYDLTGSGALLGAVLGIRAIPMLLLDVVPRAEISNAFALNTIAFSVMRTVGPAVAGFMIAWIGPAWNFALQGLLFLGVAMSAFMIAAPRPVRHAPARGTAWGDMKAGLHFAFTHPVARLMILMGLIPPLLLIPSFSALMPVFAVDVFATGPEGLGMLLSAVGVGGVLGGVLAAAVSRYDRLGIVQTLALLAFALSLIGFALCTSMAVAVLFLAVAGASEMVYANSQVTALQMSAPEALRARMASLLPVFPAFISLGALTSGIGADWVGAPATVVVMALICLGITGFAWTRHAALRELKLSKLAGVQ